MDNIDMGHFQTLMRLAYRVVSHRVMELVALLMMFGLFCWAMWLGTWTAISVAWLFGVTAFLPILLRKGDQDASST